MHLCSVRVNYRRWVLVLPVCLASLAGCSRGVQVVPVEGSVYYNDQPLPFGSVMFQPTSGQPAGARLAEDGSFRLSTFSEFDGAIVGKHKVKVTCYSSQDPALASRQPSGEQMLGVSLIPENYTYSDRSGLTAEVKPDGNEPFEFRLSGPPLAGPR